jgi:hypothetical protein
VLRKAIGSHGCFITNWQQFGQEEMEGGGQDFIANVSAKNLFCFLVSCSLLLRYFVFTSFWFLSPTNLLPSFLLFFPMQNRGGV